MLVGRLNANGAPIVSVEIDGVLYDATLDTGFESGLQLPATLFPAPPPPRVRAVKFEHANGTASWVYTYLIRVTFASVVIDAETYFSPTDEVLVGVDLLKPYRLTIDFPAGTVELA